ncbi:MAG: M20/M25/M40 family metallo-hydrolase [Actinomycetia bacterium]|nr:M20/M25/M40 family metallo-hydrolase [Actinomycetes bacterium]
MAVLTMKHAATAFGAAAAVALAATVSVAAPVEEQQGLADQMAAAVESENVLSHLQALEDIAADNDGNRAAGTSGYAASARYIEAELRAAGYTPTRHYFPFETTETETTSLVYRIDGRTTTIEHRPLTGSPDTEAGGVSGPLVLPAGASTGCSTADWAGVQVDSAIAVVERGDCPFAAKSFAAQSAGAAAIIIYTTEIGALNGTFGGASGRLTPATGVSQDEGAALVEAINAHEPQDLIATFELQRVIEERRTFNIIAETTGGDPDSVVVIGAHLDGAPEGPGINDNGSGSAAILEAAVQLAELTEDEGPQNTVRFAWWGAEELGLIGSWEYVSDLQKDDSDELERIALYLNFDMVASPNYIVGVYDADESTYPAMTTPPPGSSAAEQVFTDYFDRLGQPWVDTAYSGRSDYAAFVAAGVPSTGLFTGADGRKTADEVALFGGTEGILHDPNYHTEADDLANINTNALDIMSRAIAYATGVFATDVSMLDE